MSKYSVRTNFAGFNSRLPYIKLMRYSWSPLHIEANVHLPNENVQFVAFTRNVLLHVTLFIISTSIA